MESGSGTSMPWVSEAEVRRVLTVEETIGILREAYALVPAGEAHILPRAHVAWDGGLLHAVGAALPGAGVAGVKTWTLTPGGARPVVLVFSTQDGSLLGLVDAMALGQLRTAATAGLGTQLLARPEADTLAVIGTGRQALAQVLAVASVRPIRRLRIFGRNAGRREALADAVAQALEVQTSTHDTVAAAVGGAAVVTTVTRAVQPVLTGDLLEPGMHVNAVGAIVPTSRELDGAAIDRFDRVVVEWRRQAEQDAGDLREAAERGGLDWDAVVELGDLVGDPARGRRDDDDTTLLRTLGVGLADVAVAAAVLRRTGAPIPEPRPLVAKEHR